MIKIHFFGPGKMAQCIGVEYRLGHLSVYEFSLETHMQPLFHRWSWLLFPCNRGLFFFQFFVLDFPPKILSISKKGHV